MCEVQRRFGQIAKLKPDKVEEYDRLHSEVWPEVLQMISKCNIKNYSIFRYQTYVFAYYEYTGNNYLEDMKHMEEDEITRKWWSYTHPCFDTYAVDRQSEFYHDMIPIFYWNS